jgi:hypothetical protein
VNEDGYASTVVTLRKPKSSLDAPKADECFTSTGPKAVPAVQTPFTPPYDLDAVPSP